MNNLYLISQNKNNSYGTYDRAVVVAKDAQEASEMYPSDMYFFANGRWCYKDSKGDLIERNTFSTGWCLPKDVTVEFIGKTKNQEFGAVICSSFNAG